MNNLRFHSCLFLVLTAVLVSCSSKQEKDMALWHDDFRYQPVASRPALEVAYTDSSRTAFEITAQDYHLIGQLHQPHLLINKNDEKPWLWLEMKDVKGTQYSSRNYTGKTRINLYRRGPYYCEIHWLDVHVASEQGDIASLKGDLVLYCYPEKLLASVTWHGSGIFEPTEMTVNGLVSKIFSNFKPFEKGIKQEFAFPVFGETEPLPDDAFKLITGVNPVRYDKKRGCYIVGTHTGGGFQEKFYDEPNMYETATFSVTNDGVKRKIYICHESSDGGSITEGGIVLDSAGCPLPLVVQVSKNFPGEKEESFYNPADIPFSETFFPLYLEPGESHTLTSLHLFQNWGRHMTKHWSSLGAWMDYFHSSTGVTETTCYVPFKFAGLDGVAIADFRAMSQDCFWSGQPQHDNLAGHSFLSYFDGKDWIHSVYKGTTYRSTGPNWYDIGLHYLTADGKVKETIDIFEAPQSDELRSYFKARYEILESMTIEDAKVNFRFLNITSRIQDLRFNRFAATGVPETFLDPAQMPFPVKGISMSSENFFIALYGDSVNWRGSNAIVVKKFSAPGITPAATVQLGAYRNVFEKDRDVDTRLLLVPDMDQLVLKAGNVIEIEGYWLPYGATYDTKSPEMLTKFDAECAPHVVDVVRGEKVNDLPLVVQAKNNKAEFSIAGGKNLTPVVVKGFTKWRNPQIFVKENKAWRLLSHSRNQKYDGYQVFCDEDGTFASVFLVPTGLNQQKLKVTVSEEGVMPPKLGLEVEPDLKSVSIQKDEAGCTLVIPELTSAKEEDLRVPVVWKQSEGNSEWFIQQLADWERGGRLSPNEDDIDLEYWWQNKKGNVKHTSPKFILDLKNLSSLPSKEFYMLVNGEWEKISETVGIKEAPVQAVAVRSGETKIIALSFRNATGAFCTAGQIGLDLKAVPAALHQRYHVRGKIYLVSSNMNVLRNRILMDLF